MTQMVAESYAQDFNKACAEQGLSHCVAFLPVSAVRLTGVAEPVCLEPYMSGVYVKHNNNTGRNNTNDEVAAAFSYFTYVASGGRLLVCDIQGVGTFYTDPQIHTFNGVGFGLGNLGREGIHRFLRNHRPNQLCEQLGLPSPDLGHDPDGSDEQRAQNRLDHQGDQRHRSHAVSWNGERYMTGFTALQHRLGGVSHAHRQQIRMKDPLDWHG